MRVEERNNKTKNGNPHKWKMKKKKNAAQKFLLYNEIWKINDAKSKQKIGI
mgnify:CR=1 FL=1